MIYSLQKLFDFMPFLPDILGILGVLIILSYYFLIQIDKCSPKDLNFSVGNLIGSILLLISLLYNWNLASVLIEIAWSLISIYGITQYYLRSKTQK